MPWQNKHEVRKMEYIFLVAYILALLAIAFVSRKKANTLDGYLLGNRNIGPWVSAFAYGTTYFSAVIFVGYSGQNGWVYGMSAILIGLGNAVIGSYLSWKVLARRTRAITQRLNVATMPEYFEQRYGSKGFKILAACIIFIFLTPYCASVYQGLSYLFEQSFGIPFIWCILGMALLTGIYLIFGGYIATAMSGFFQGIIMLVGIVLLVVFELASPQVGGLAHGAAQLSAIDPSLGSIFQCNDVVGLISMILLTSIGCWGLPQMIHKFYTIRDNKAIKTGTAVSTAFAAIVGGGAYFVGVFGRLFFGNVLPEGGYDVIVPYIVKAVLPEIFIGLIVVLVLAASMSTLSSLVLASSSSITVDLVKGCFKPQMKDGTAVFLMRICCIAFVAISVVIAILKPASIVTLMSFSWGTISGCFLAPYLFGLYWRRTTKAGAWAAMAGGLVISLVLALLSLLQVPIFGSVFKAPLIGVITMVASCLLLWVGSLCTQPYDQEHLDRVCPEKGICPEQSQA